ncbi:cold-shock protein [Spirosoma linguale]|uniref:Cold-shock protein DNA-binding protein n=1 Tax=Spirosoma linguale (strain ATCC 33905 / DSM 74 / LMG 10896 / Claus 1) TaxID=504472 RepID=D2QBV6_SPILD|nr:Cold-shock protein DNA-binding protein [Spirosoma linguale DSM 74]
MNVHFGVVKKYFPEKGFGFVSHPLDSKTRQDVFFHIKNVQKSNKVIAEKLSSYDPNDIIYFYYESETTPKGEQVKSILLTDGIDELLKSNSHNFTQKLERIWQDFETTQPVWLCDVTQNVIGVDGLNRLKHERELLKEKKREAEELKRQEREKVEAERQAQLELQRQERERIEAERQKQREIQEQQRKIEQAEQERQNKIRDEEFKLLVAEIKPKGFTMSWQVSNYIIKNRLGDKYKHISGILVMENESSTWKFNGGFPPDIYAKLCQEIGLGNKGTNSRVVGFTAFKDL